MYKTIGETYGFTLNCEILSIFHKASKKKMDLLKALASEIQQEYFLKSSTFGNRRSKALLEDSMVVYIENSELSIKELVKWRSKLTNLQNSKSI